jgi:hypothetical protein
MLGKGLGCKAQLWQAQLGARLVGGSLQVSPGGINTRGTSGGGQGWWKQGSPSSVRAKPWALKVQGGKTQEVGRSKPGGRGKAQRWQIRGGQTMRSRHGEKARRVTPKRGGQGLRGGQATRSKPCGQKPKWKQAKRGKVLGGNSPAGANPVVEVSEGKNPGSACPWDRFIPWESLFPGGGGGW